MQNLPTFSLQHDFSNVFNDVIEKIVETEDIYLSCYKPGSPSVHGKVNVSLGAEEIVLDSRDGVDLKRIDAYSLSASCIPLGIYNTTLRVPFQTLSVNPSTVVARRISAFDVAPDSSLIATGHHDGTISLQSSPSAPAPLPLTTKKPHFGTVLALRFFPSSKVLLSASADLSLQILSASASDPSEVLIPARTMKGHKASITDAYVVPPGTGPGTSVRSCSKDGTIRTWDVAAGTSSGTMASDKYKPIMRMAASDPGANPNVIFGALQDGTFDIFDSRTKNLVYASPVSSERNPLLSIAYNRTSNMLATGSVKGVVNIYDTRVLSSPSPTTPVRAPNTLASFNRSNASIDDLLFIPMSSQSALNPDLLVAQGDGLPFRARIHPGESEVRIDVFEELVGFADEGVRVLRTSGGNIDDGRLSIWCAGDDGIIRKY